MVGWCGLGFFFLNNYKVFEIEREIFSEMNKIKRLEIWRD